MFAARAFAIALLFVAAFMPARQAPSTERSLPLPRKTYDVVVVGSTPAGIAAALAAAERGLRVAFLTRETVLGGDLTLGMLTRWDLQHASDGSILQGGLFEQFYRALPSGFDPAFAARYFKEQVLSSSRITWLAGVRIVKVFHAGDGVAPIVTGIETEKRDRARLRIDARYFIDATRNGDFAAEAGARYDVGRQDQGLDTRMQPATLIFQLADIDWQRVPVSADGYRALLKGYWPLSPSVVVRDANLQRQTDGTVMMNAIDVMGVDGRDPRSLADAQVVARAESIHLTAFLRRRLSGFENARIVRFAPQLYVRETRHVRGLLWIRAGYIWKGRIPYDTIALASYPMDVHPVTSDSFGGDGWASEPRFYGVPLRALVVSGLQNLAIVGNAISASHDASGSLRVLPTTIAEGEAAAAACAVALRRDTDLKTIAMSASLVRFVQSDLVLHHAMRGSAGQPRAVGQRSQVAARTLRRFAAFPRSLPRSVSVGPPASRRRNFATTRSASR